MYDFNKCGFYLIHICFLFTKSLVEFQKPTFSIKLILITDRLRTKRTKHTRARTA